MAKTFRICNEAVNKRIQKMLDIRKRVLEDGVKKYHPMIMKGNKKTGRQCYTVSLIPIVDCSNCKECKNNCYDIRNDCIYPDVLESRGINSAIHHADPERYWWEIGKEVEEKAIHQLRINVGGDLKKLDFKLVAKMGETHVGDCEDMFFTKVYSDCNEFITENISKYPDNFGFPRSVHPLYSRWLGMHCDNPYNVPESHVLWPDGITTAPEFGAYFCKGNCSNCFNFDEGCPRLKAGESVVFNAH